MARAAHPERTKALIEIRKAIAEHGDVAGPGIARKQFPAVGAPTWKTWLRTVRAGDDVAITAPPDPTAMPAVTALAVDAPPLDFNTRIAMMDRQAAMIVAVCVNQVTDPQTGEVTVKCRNPMMLERAVRLQGLAAKLMIDNAENVLGLERMRDYMEELVTALSDAVKLEAPDVTERIVRRLHAVQQDQRDRLNGIAPKKHLGSLTS